MKTGSIKTYTGPGRIIISRSIVGYVPSGYRSYKKLAPGDYFRTASKPEYTQKFFAQLAQLDPLQTWNELEELADGCEPVLLCYEVPPFTEKNWCHRRMVADWFKQELGREDEEFELFGAQSRNRTYQR